MTVLRAERVNDMALPRPTQDTESLVSACMIQA